MADVNQGIAASSGNVANASAVATLAAVVGKLNFITGFVVSGAGATVGAVVTVSLTGLAAGTLAYTYAVPTGATVGVTPLHVTFQTPLPASGTNVAISVTVPSLGAGNTNTTVTCHGFQL